MSSKIKLRVTRDEKYVVDIDYSSLRKTVLTLRALNHPKRKQILRMLEEKNEMKVTEIYTRLNLTQSVASQHLAMMRRAGILHSQRQGKFVIYRIDHDQLEKIRSLIDTIVGKPQES